MMRCRIQTSFTSCCRCQVKSISTLPTASHVRYVTTLSLPIRHYKVNDAATATAAYYNQYIRMYSQQHRQSPKIIIPTRATTSRTIECRQWSTNRFNQYNHLHSLSLNRRLWSHNTGLSLFYCNNMNQNISKYLLTPRIIQLHRPQPSWASFYLRFHSTSGSNNNNSTNKLDNNTIDKNINELPNTTSVSEKQQNTNEISKADLQKSSTSSTETSTNPNNATTSTTAAATSSTKGVSDAVAAATQELELRIKRVVRGEHLTIGDQLSVAIIAIFTSIILIAPYAVRHMKQRANTVYGYEDRLQTDDPVDEFAKLARREWNMMNGNDDIDDMNNSNNNNGNEEKNQKFIEVILKDVLQSTTVQHAAQEFVIQIIQSERFQSTVQHFVKELWNDLITDPETVAQVIKLLEIAITSTPIKNAVIELILQIAVRETEFRDAMIQMIQNLGTDEQVQKAVVQLLTDATHTTLNDPDILDHSMEFATDVVGDDIVQQTAGEALRRSVEHAVKPATTIFLSACGVGLLIFSFIALGYSRSSEMEVQIFSSAARSLQSNASLGMLRIVSWPFRTIPTFIYNIMDTMMTGLHSQLQQIGTSMYNGLYSISVQAVSIPWNGLLSGLEWIAATSGRMIHKAGISLYNRFLVSTNKVGLWIDTTTMTLISITESGIRSIAIRTWKYTLNGLRLCGHSCWQGTVQTTSYITQQMVHLFNVLYQNLFHEQERSDVW